ncbi:cyclic nucleotide-binding domain-containing protein [Indioceanicola profundi]|uniref:cyclic nucleotide-binding domain-containing protein n=1 Tax=Indioceanicola profundi TaxID=2220096 RepID=UPI000E6AAD7C|nr:cyclic nucleotide-binding domain-containing protein [Indioceanicola profundi]
MSIAEDVEALRRIKLFANIEVSKLKLLAFTSERVGFEAGAVLFRQDEVADAAYVVLEGEAEIIVETPQGPVVVAVVEKNGVLGEIAILCDVPRTATVRARTQLRCLRVSKEQFFRLITEFPQMAVEIMRELAQRLEKTTRELGEARGG